MNQNDYIGKYAKEAVREELKERFRGIMKNWSTGDLLSALDDTDDRQRILLTDLMFTALDADNKKGV